MRPKQSRPAKVGALLIRMGFRVRAGKGSHRMYARADGRTTTISFHPGPIPTGTLRGIIEDAGLTVEEFNERI